MKNQEGHTPLDLATVSTLMLLSVILTVVYFMKNPLKNDFLDF